MRSTKRKITFSVPSSLWSKFTDLTAGAFINMAPFLSNVIEKEIPWIEEDLAGKDMSEKARRYIGGELKRQGAKPVNVEIDSDVADALDKVVKAHGINRNALFCRILVFLIGSDKLLDQLEIPVESGVGVDMHQSLGALPSSPMKAIESVYDDPFLYIRVNLRKRWGQGMYEFPLTRWTACVMDDVSVPDTADYKRMMAEL